MGEKPKRVIVDPAVQEAEDAFQRMMARFRAMPREEWLRWHIEHGLLNEDGTPRLPEGDPCVTPMTPVPLLDSRTRVIVDPAVQEAEDAFQRMMERFRRKTPEERLRFGVERGLLNPDGSPKLPEGDPCVTIVR